MPRLLPTTGVSLVALLALSGCSIDALIDKIDTGVPTVDRQASTTLDQDGPTVRTGYGPWLPRSSRPAAV